MIDIFCIASGPSLTKTDCGIVSHSGSKILAVNNSWQMFERCDYIYAGDVKWWKAHFHDIDIPGEKWTSSKGAALDYGLNLHRSNGPFNSGMRAILFAIEQGFKTIGLLGYDCSVKHGKHWHPDHKIKNAFPPDNQKISKWKLQFLKAERQASRLGVKIYNCSRHTELGCFPVANLEDVI